MRKALNFFVVVMWSGFLFANVQKGHAQTQSPTAIAVPVVFTHAIDASKAHVGDTMTAKTLQIVLLPNGKVIPKGTTILGHIAETRSFSFDPTPYAVQQPSVLSIRFDKLTTKEATMNVVMSVRAMAGWSNSESAVRPEPTDEHDIVGTVHLIGGDSYRADEKPITTPDGDIVGYNRKDGVFARLLDSEYSSRYSHFQCEGSGEAEQAVAVFSPSACGLYGLQDVYMADDGLGKEAGTFRLESRKHTVKVYAQSTALLQIVNLQ
jgi:hypothetical protein